MFFSERTLALLVPFFVAASQATAVSLHDSFVLVTPNFPIITRPDPSSFHQIDVPGDVTTNAQTPPAQTPAPSPVELLTGGFDCKPNNDWGCYKRYYQEYNYCHPQDVFCYKDCKDWNHYKEHCFHKDGPFQCYDKCHYQNQHCDQWIECRDHDYDCYKRRHDDHYRNIQPPKNQPQPPKTQPGGGNGGNYCQPWDWNCHHKDHHDHGEYVCNPWKDKSCYPYFYPEPRVPVLPPPKQPNNDVLVFFFSPCEGPCHEHGYSRKIWPDGDEVFLGESPHDFDPLVWLWRLTCCFLCPEMNHVIVDHITYVTDKGDEDVRCLPMLNYFPWTPLPLEKYVEKFEGKDGKKMRVLHLKEPQPVELIRCDFF